MKKDSRIFLLASSAILIIYSSICRAWAQNQDELALNNKGIGPVKSIKIGPLDTKTAEKGKEIFTTKCSACHKFGSRYVGPDLAGITKRRSSEWIMNMMLNPKEMIEKDPIAQGLFEEFLVPMTFQNVSQDDARAILEYMRQQEK